MGRVGRHMTQSSSKSAKSKTEKIINELFILARDKERVANARIVAALVYKGKIISYGFNQNRTSWVQRRFKKNPHAHFLHAEVDAVKNAMKVIDADTISKSTLIIARAKSVSGKEEYGLAKPCDGCQSCIDWFNIKRVYYTLDGSGYEQLKCE